MAQEKLKIGVYGFTGCAGDQLLIIHSEDQLLDFFNVAEIRSFLMAKSDNIDDELDVAFVEGSISTKEQVEKIKEIRKRSKIVVAIGHCACFGGIQSMYTGDGTYEKRLKAVYGDKINFEIDTPIEAKPIDAYIKVDYYIPGCPIDQKQFFAAFSKIIHGTKPVSYWFPVCTECKWKENDCLLLKGILCLGHITNAGCGAICPSHNLPCVGCWGLYDDANLKSQINLLLEKGFSKEEILKRFKTFGGPKMTERLKEVLEEEEKNG